MKTAIINLLGPIAPFRQHPKSLSERFTKIHVSTFPVKDKLLVASGLQKELIIKYLDKSGDCFCCRSMCGDDSITTNICINNIASGVLYL